MVVRSAEREREGTTDELWTFGGRGVGVGEGAVDDAEEAREHEADGVAALCGVGAAAQQRGALRVRVEQRGHQRSTRREQRALHRSFTHSPRTSLFFLFL